MHALRDKVGQRRKRVKERDIGRAQAEKECVKTSGTVKKHVALRPGEGAAQTTEQLLL